MTLQRPTLQARLGWNPTGFGPGIMAPYGHSKAYTGHHNGEDYFWLTKVSADRLGISTEQSKRVYPVRDGYVGHTEDPVLGLGMWQQIDAEHRFFWWHLRDRNAPGVFTAAESCGRMGRTGSSAGDGEHLHGEVRRSPYRKQDRINPAPFFTNSLEPDGTPIIPPTPSSGAPMFNLVTAPDSGLIYIQGFDGRYEGIQSAEHLSLLRRYRNAMLTPGTPNDPNLSILWGEMRIVQWYLARVNAVNIPAPLPETSAAPARFTEEQLLQIDAQLADDFRAVRDDVNRPRTVS